jgi:predicted nucleic acid-binding protein
LNLYVESSAVLAWLLGEPDSEGVRARLADADEVLTSDLTLVECDRALIRARASLRLRESEITRRRRALETAASHWTLLRISPAIIERARNPFPGDPVRTLDAVHLASALGAAQTADDLAILSLDRRVRHSARALGLEVLPAG